MPYMIIAFIATILVFFGLTWWSMIFMFIILSLLTTKPYSLSGQCGRFGDLSAALPQDSVRECETEHGLHRKMAPQTVGLALQLQQPDERDQAFLFLIFEKFGCGR